MSDASAQFDTSEPGVPETVWRSWLDNARYWQPSGGPLAVVAPHPDDETLGAGGLIATWCELGWPVTLIAITRGEAARPEMSGLAEVRRRERSNALRVLGGARIPLVELYLPDGRVQEHEERLHELLAACLGRSGWMVAPFEEDGHPDHDATGRVCIRLAARKGWSVARYPIWSWYRGSSALRSQRNVVRFKLSEANRLRKRRALEQFHSQTEEREGGAILPAHVLQYFETPYEAFVL